MKPRHNVVNVDRWELRSHGAESYVTKDGLLWLKNVGLPLISLSGTLTLHVITDIKLVSKGCVCVASSGAVTRVLPASVKSRWLHPADRGPTFFRNAMKLGEPASRLGRRWYLVCVCVGRHIVLCTV